MTEVDTSTRPRARASVWRPIFLETLRETGNVTLAARAANIPRQTAYKARNTSKRFADQWHEALEEGVDMLESEARRRAEAGSDRLMIVLLKAYRPEKFRENYQVEHSGQVEVDLSVVESMEAKVAAMVQRMAEEEEEA